MVQLHSLQRRTCSLRTKVLSVRTTSQQKLNPYCVLGSFLELQRRDDFLTDLKNGLKIIRAFKEVR